MRSYAQSNIDQGQKITVLERRVDALKGNGELLDSQIKHNVMPKLGQLENELANTLGIVQNDVGPQGEKLREAIQSVEGVRAELVKVSNGLVNHEQRITKVALDVETNSRSFQRLRMDERTRAQSQRGQLSAAPTGRTAATAAPLPTGQYPPGRISGSGPSTHPGNHPPQCSPPSPPGFDTPNYYTIPSNLPNGGLPVRSTAPNQLARTPPGFDNPNYYNQNLFQFDRAGTGRAPTPVSQPPSSERGFSQVVVEESQRSCAGAPTLPAPPVSRPPANVDASTSQGRATRMIRNSIRNIVRITNQQSTDLCDLNTMVKHDIPRVENLRNELNRLLENFQKDYLRADDALEEECVATSQVAEDWMNDIQACHRQQGGNSTSGEKKDIELIPYQRHGDQTIWTFFDNFEAYFKGCSQIYKARALY